ncbi:MAG: vitamin K epoxide reductase family protein, partial [Anaerolineales bacterium]|nr:vitamin K epoxide reductase family protein [Anaerolineales bacterium]
LLFIGLVVGIYMTIFKATGNEAMCLGSGACSTVTASRYSEINGIDVPVIGVIGNIALLAILFFENRNSFLQKNGTLVFFAVALAGFAVVLWLIYVEIFILKALCPFCVTAQTMMMLTFIIAVTRLIRNPQV